MRQVQLRGLLHNWLFYQAPKESELSNSSWWSLRNWKDMQYEWRQPLLPFSLKNQRYQSPDFVRRKISFAGLVQKQVKTIRKGPLETNRIHEFDWWLLFILCWHIRRKWLRPIFIRAFWSCEIQVRLCRDHDEA